MLEKTVGTIKSGQSREAGNIEYKRHKTKTNKTKTTTHYVWRALYDIQDI